MAAGRGRPLSYDAAKHPKFAESMCKLGATDEDVADGIGISVRTLYRWRAKYPKFCQALKVGKDPADDRVELSLYHRATGYSHPEDDIRTVNGEIVITPTTKHYPPDTMAMIYWLNNRRPDRWKKAPEGESPDLAAALMRLADKLPE